MVLVVVLFDDELLEEGYLLAQLHDFFLAIAGLRLVVRQCGRLAPLLKVVLQLLLRLVDLMAYLRGAFLIELSVQPFYF